MELQPQNGSLDLERVVVVSVDESFLTLIDGIAWNIMGVW